MFENNVVVYRFVQDLHFFVTGGHDENELALATVLQFFFDAITLLLRGNVDQREALENLDLIFLCLDEIVDGGMILEIDGNMIAGKVATHSLDEGSPLSEQLGSLAEIHTKLKRSWVKKPTSIQSKGLRRVSVCVGGAITMPPLSLPQIPLLFIPT
ncbi:hypothetical protein L6452_23642 [Arctium lappa]|uniref:Uncharacterized protein n=1 Tax=Arctium lappa TaxID=4217 RepID=A0ACB9B2F1_ARCLA|nr:hypothetical protein L6452_23642 [Arctium lappa]